MSTIQLSRRERITIERKKALKERNKKLTIATTIGALSALLLTNGNARACSAEYTVKKHDTLYSLAKKYDVTVDQLKEKNVLLSDKIYAGQTLLVPPIESHIENNYSVQQGDTLYSLAKRYGTTIAHLKQLNGMDSDQINIGKSILVPGEQTQLNVGELYTVVAGDTLWGVAHRFGIKQEVLAKSNDLKMNMLLIGQNLFIPGKAEVTEAEIIGVPDKFTVELKKNGKSFSLKIPYGTSSDYQKKSGQIVIVIHRNGAVISAT
ncbi:LysM peptidoglycan-binding domain-containing protein [Bacillus sp. BHET2]|uniref:LysM peptidoglycan-binding domain-containing protein n=1 Tax=Bacillus sp. BHET2 TaxID=2583818 RepID=UPI0014860FFB|nr:LysM peptidoglycan-binding domain-containing protein [Bacillus sp. BHET2]